jgi:hypothetical protein
MTSYGKALYSAPNFAIAGVAAGSAALVGLLVTPGLFLEIPVHNGKFNIIRKEKFPYHPLVVAVHVLALAILVFLIVLFTAPAFRNMTISS